MKCDRCDQPLSGRQKRFCSQRCSKLFLKAEYKRRNKIKVSEYNRNWRKARYGSDGVVSNPRKYRDEKCLNCGSVDDLQVAHVKPMGLGGTSRHLITLCRRCHYNYDERLRGFWVVSS